MFPLVIKRDVGFVGLNKINYTANQKNPRAEKSKNKNRNIMKKIHFTSAAICIGLAFSACTSSLNECKTNNNDIVAGIEEPTDTRTCIDGDPAAAGASVGLLWTAGDEIGVFAKEGTQVRYSKKTAASEREAVFTTSASEVEPAYAYYPYNAANDGRPVTSLYGTVPSTQEMTSGNISGDYKYGRVQEGDNANGYKFVFQHFFSIVNVSIDAAGTALADDVLKSVTLNVKRGDADVRICGDFTFNVLKGSWSINSSAATTLTMDWGEGTSLGSTISRYISVFPEIKAGDVLNFEFTTAKHTASLQVTCKVDFQKEMMYAFPLKLSNFADKIVIDGGKTDPEPEVTTGTFTCATYNVDGLPDISYIIGSTNPDGPGASGTTKIGTKINNSAAWDFFGVAEDFEYDSYLRSALTNYNGGKWRGTVSAKNASSRADTDGLCFFWKNTITVSPTANEEGYNKNWIQYEHEEGGLTGGANTCIKKGLRYYLVTLSDGTQIDVYITHMNTYSGGNNKSDYINAQHGQLTEIVNYIKAHQNGRPIIIMGDTNMRYTRHKVKELLIDAINAVEGLEIHDPWIDYPREGVYPTYGGKSIMAYGTNDTEHDDCGPDGKGYGYYLGEVVDKVFYINIKGAATQIKANDYRCDNETYANLADHYPVVINFSYTTTKTTEK